MSEKFEVTLPKLGESIMNATVVQWFKKEGDFIKKDEPLLEVSTDKVNSEIPSPVAGIVKTLCAQPDEELDVGDLLAVIETSGKETKTTHVKTEKKQEEQVADNSDYYSPAILRLAREHNISFETLEKIPGTGGGGRITKKDIEDYLAKPAKKPQHHGGEIEQVKMSGMRKAIADNMVRSFYEAPHASLITEVDVTDVMETIQKEKEKFLEKHGVKLTFTAFVARAMVKALREYPLLNSSLDKDTIVIKRFVNLGIAVNIDEGLMVPVIKHCDKMTLPQIAEEIQQLAHKARTGKLSPDSIRDGTITLTNFGMTGVQIGIPIIRFPEVAIIGIGGVTKKVAVIKDDMFGVRQMLYISLTFDHRVLDGIYGCGFLGSVKKHLETDLSIL